MCWFAILMYVEHGMKKLAKATQKKYRDSYAPEALHHFGHWWCDDLENTHAAQFLQWCEENDRAVVGNRVKSFLSSVFEYAMRKGWSRRNPFRGVRRNTEGQSLRYVTHEELVPTLDRAHQDAAELYPLMGIAYLLGIRQTDLRLVRRVQDEGRILKVVESKTGKPNEHEITPTVRLLLSKAAEHRAAVVQWHEKAAEMHERLSQYRRAEKRRAKAAEARNSPYIFLSKRGLPWSEWGLQSALRRFDAPFQFRQLRPKAQTDRPDKDILGHTGQMRERYHKVRRLSAVK
jgi:site-specific recombinase XerD